MIDQLLMADNDVEISDMMDRNVISIKATTPIEDALKIFNKYDKAVMPITSDNGALVGIVTFDDILDQIIEKDTNAIHKFGGTKKLEFPYTKTTLFDLVKKRGFWMIILFFGEMLTVSAMGYFNTDISKAVVLALFVPLIISSGGNSGFQAASLVIRVMILNEIKLKNWWFVMKKEIFSGLLLGLILAVIGFLCILVWQNTGFYDYGEYWIWIAISVSLSLFFIVLWGTLSGSMIPFILKKIGLDPATASAPLIATFVDVTGLIIYLAVGILFLNGKLL
jgi:magnesium transporter